MNFALVLGKYLSHQQSIFFFHRAVAHTAVSIVTKPRPLYQFKSNSKVI